MIIYFLLSEDENVYKNLAYETCLVNYVSQIHAGQNIPIAILFLWKNDKTIVLGKHQNYYKECNQKFVEDNNIRVSRRITGGGAVYHDTGNLNFSFISSKDIYKKEENFKIIINALKRYGIEAELSGRNDILIDGKKFSGNAFFNNKYCSLHHGTILVNSNCEILSNCLTPNKFKLKSKGVNSVKSRILNLKEVNSEISIEKLILAIKQEYANKYGLSSKEEIEIDSNEFKNLYRKYSSKDWIYQNFSDEGIEISKYFSWGNFTAKILIKDSVIENICMSTDALEVEIFDELQNNLKGVNFAEEDVKSVFSRYDTQIAKDLENLFLSHMNK